MKAHHGRYLDEGHVGICHNHKDVKDIIGDIEMTWLDSLSTFEDIEDGLKKMANDKVFDTMYINVEPFKYIGYMARTWLSHLLEYALTHGFPSN